MTFILNSNFHLNFIIGNNYYQIFEVTGSCHSLIFEKMTAKYLSLNSYSLSKVLSNKNGVPIKEMVLVPLTM